MPMVSETPPSSVCSLRFLSQVALKALSIGLEVLAVEQIESTCRGTSKEWTQNERVDIVGKRSIHILEVGQ